jgi:hypothetical protein
LFNPRSPDANHDCGIDEASYPPNATSLTPASTARRVTEQAHRRGERARSPPRELTGLYPTRTSIQLVIAAAGGNHEIGAMTGRFGRQSSSTPCT